MTKIKKVIKSKKTKEEISIISNMLIEMTKKYVELYGPLENIPNVEDDQEERPIRYFNQETQQWEDTGLSFFTRKIDRSE